MNTAYFDCFSGVSGDMALGALVDLGVPIETLISGMKQLKALKDWSIETRKERRGAIEGTRVLISGGERLIPEYEECRRIAEETGTPLPDVYRRVMESAK
jgi:hypothetical protein